MHVYTRHHKLPPLTRFEQQSNVPSSSTLPFISLLFSPSSLSYYTHYLFCLTSHSLLNPLIWPKLFFVTPKYFAWSLLLHFPLSECIVTICVNTIYCVYNNYRYSKAQILIYGDLLCSLMTLQGTAQCFVYSRISTNICWSELLKSHYLELLEAFISCFFFPSKYVTKRKKNSFIWCNLRNL